MNKDLAADRSLVTDYGDVVPELVTNQGMFLDRTVAIYGPSMTGKTVITKYVMTQLKPHVDEIIVIAPTEPTNNSYKDVVPSTCIHYTINLPDPKDPKKDDGQKGALRFIQALWDRQSMKAAIYKRASNVATLESLFCKLPNDVRRTGLVAIRKITDRKAVATEQLRRQFSHDAGLLAQKTKELRERFQEVLSRVYRSFILPHHAALLERRDLSEDELYSLTYLEFNPRMLLVFDDCAAQMKPLFPKEVFRKLFYQNRHSFLSVILCLQDDTDLPTNLRKNAFVSFFTTDIVAASNFKRGSNQFPKSIHKMVDRVMPVLFSESNPHRKLAYIREDPTRRQFYHFTAPIPRPFRFGSDALWELCDECAADGNTMDEENPYFTSFKLDLAV